MATLLDLFAVGFSSEGVKDFEQNLKSTEKELDDTEKKVSSLEKELDELEAAEVRDGKAIAKTKIELSKSKDKVKELTESLKTMKSSGTAAITQIKSSFAKLTKTLGSLAVIGATIKKSLDFYEQGAQLDFLAQKTGVAIEALQNLGNASQKYGGSTETTANTIENLNTVETKEKALKYGIRIVGDNPEETFENIAAKMEKLKSESAKMNLAKDIGLDEATTRLVIDGVEKYRETIKRADKYRLYSEDDIKRMREYRQMQQDIRMGLESVFGTVYRSLLPAIMSVAKVVKNIIDWLVEHQGIVKIVALSVGIVGAIMAIKGAIGILSIALKALLANPVVLTIVAIIAAVAALIAIVNDFIVFLQGGDSVIGDLLAGWGFDVDQVRAKCLKAIEDIKKWISNFIAKLKEWGTNIKEFWDNVIPDWAKKGIGRMIPGFNIIQTAKQGGDMLRKYNSSKLNPVPQSAMSTYNQTSAINNNNNANTQQQIDTSKKYMSTFNEAPKKTTTINTINIQTQATNGAQVASELSNAISDYDDGIVA